MKRRIELNKRSVEYIIRKSKRAKRMRLAVYCDGNFVVTIPNSFNQGTIEKFIIQKSKWILEKMDYFKLFPVALTTKSSRKTDFFLYKEQARVLVEKKVSEFNKIYDFKFNKINIKNQKTRWGSCSKKGNLNFNYKIALIPEKLADYIVVHELCHLGEFNHSQKFWNLVARAIPEYKDLRIELQKNVRML